MFDPSELTVETCLSFPAAEIPKSDSSKQGVEEDELDGLPVFGAVEDEGDVESSPTQKDKQTEGRDERENGNAVALGDNDAGEGVQSSQVEDRPSQTEGSASSQEPGEGSQKEIISSPLKKIKDEPIDEDYDKALVSSANSDISRVKEELENGDNESLVPLDELRISSVFSVRGNSDSISAPVTAPQPASFSAITQRASPIRPPPIVLQAQMPPHFQAHLQLQPKTLAQLQPHLQTHLQAQLQTHLQPQLQLQAQLQAHLQTQLQPQLSHQLQPQLSHQIPLHPQLPHQLQPQTPPQLQTQPPSHSQPQPTHQLQPQPQPPPGPVRICCSGCSKVLQKGQTAFQKKGSNQLFCSTVCLTGFTLPPAPNIAPKKTCHLCLKVIGNPKDLITVPVDSANNLKEFCSLSCLSIYKSRVEGLTEEESIVRCSVCRNPSEIQHEVNHQGVLHRLCSDECFSRFRSSKRLSMSCCESCGNCTVTGNYHLVQIEDAIKKFCSPACITTFKQKSGKRVHCPCCQDFKAMDQMMEGTNAQGVIEFFCSSRCVANSQASCTLSGASFPCTNCQKLAVPQYHLAMSDGSIRNFCSYECVGRFQERLQRSSQMNGGSYHSPNTVPQPPVPLHPSSVPASVQNTTPPSVPASRPTNSHDPQQQAEALGPAKLTCKQCQKQFSSKPEVLQFKNHTGLFCSRLCCDMYKRERDVGAVCEYCKEEKIAKEIVMYDKQPRTFCCEGCKLLYKHDYAKQHGGQSRVCAYCSNVTHKSLQNHFGGKLEEFCSKECMSLYTVLFYEMAKCHACRNQGPLKESIRWDETVRHFCNLQCLLHFCSKSIIPDQPNSNGINTAPTTAQAPLSLSKDMPVIGGIVSLASALAGNTALTGALPTSNASSKISGDASTQTDVSVNGDPQQRRMLKNKAIMCKPISDEQSIQCELEPPKLLSKTVIDENGEKVKLVPVPIPVPTPVYIPVPVHLYTQYTPLPLGFPFPIPVPLVVPASQESAQPSSTKGSVPSQSSVEDEDVEKAKSRPLCHGDQGSNYSGDLESEARSTPFSWADPEDSSHKPPVTLYESEGPKDPPGSATGSDLLDLEKDIPLATTDHEATKEQKSSAKRRKRGKKLDQASDVEKTKSFVEVDVADRAQSCSDTNLEQFKMESCQHGGSQGSSIPISSECAPLDEDDLSDAQNTAESGEELTSSSVIMRPLRSRLKTGSKRVRAQASRTKKQFCVYCQKSNTKIARHLERMHSKETDVAFALSFPKRSKRRHMLLEQLRKKGNYQHNIEVIRNGNGDIVMQKQTKRKRSAMEYLPCQYCLAFFLRVGLAKHENWCKSKMISQAESSKQLDTEHESKELESPKSSSEARLNANLQPSPHVSGAGCSDSQKNLETCSFSNSQSSPDISDQTDPKPGLGSSHPNTEPFPPTSSDIGQSPKEYFSDKPNPQSNFESHEHSNELSSPAVLHPTNQSCHQSTFSEESFDLCLPSSPVPSPLPNSESSTSHLNFDLFFEDDLFSDPEDSLPRTPELFESNTLETCLESSMMHIDASSSANPRSCHQSTIGQINSPDPTQLSFESCILANVGCDLRSPPCLELKNHTESPFMLNHESTLQPKFESCSQVDQFSPKNNHQTANVSDEHRPDPSKASFELCPSSKTPPQPHLESGPSPQINCSESCFQPVLRSGSDTSLFPESFPKQVVESNINPPARSSPVRSPPASSAEANTESIQQSSSAGSHCLDSDASSNSDCTASNCESPVSSSAESSLCEKSSPQSSSNSSLTCTSTFKPALSEQTSSHKTLNGQGSGMKRQYCVYCKNSFVKISRHLSLKHAKETDVAHALSFRKGSEMRQLLFEKLRKKGNYQHNVEVLKSGCGELIPDRRGNKDSSGGVYLPCQYCLAFYVRHELWRHEKRCKMRTNLNPVCLKRTACSKSIPYQGSISGDLEEAIRSMKQDNLLRHIINDALICKYGARLIEKLGHGKKHKVYAGQRMRALARFMLVVKELDGSVEYLHHVCTPSKLDLVIKGVRIVSGFDETLGKFKTPSLALQIATSIRQAAEIICGENVTEGDMETAANVKKFIWIIEENLISRAKKNADHAPADSCLGNPSAALPQENCPVTKKPSRKLRPRRNVARKKSATSPVVSNGSHVYIDENETLPRCDNAAELPTDPGARSKSKKSKAFYSKSKVLRTEKGGNKHYCVYCKKQIIKIARHLSQSHAKEKDVARALSFPKASKTRQCLFKQLRNKGDYQYNIKVQQTGNGEIIPQRRQKKQSVQSLSSYQACPYCLGFFLERDLWRHKKSCKWKKDDEAPSGRERPRSANIALHESLSEGCQSIVRNMRNDEISKCLSNDALICKFGNSLYKKHGHEKGGHDYVAQKMRTLGRFMLAVKELDQNVEDLYQVCNESRFSLALEVAKKVGGFDQQTNKFKKSVGWKMGYYMKWATEVALEENDMDDEARNQATKFIQMMETNWFSYKPFMQNEEDIELLAEDIVKLQNFLKNSEDKAKSELIEHPNGESWKSLCNTVLAEMTLFNRGRRIVAEKMLLEDYKQRNKEAKHEKTCHLPTKLEWALKDVLIKTVITGSQIPVLFTKRMASSLDILIKHREDVGVPADNPYVFPYMLNNSYIKARDCIKTLAKNCGVSKLEVHTHKSVATVFQILSLDGSEMQKVAALVGEKRFNYQTLNQNLPELAKICAQLQTTQNGIAARKKTGRRRRPASQGCKRHKWKKAEQGAVRKHLGHYISTGIVPRKKDCLDCIKTDPEALSSRTWTDVKNFVHNTIQAKKRKKSDSRETDSESEELSDDLSDAVAVEAAAKRPRRKRKLRRRL
ncbi:zinc finger MYM-type protein 4-like isoform X3 [Silurus asotus]|uniref:Zinc finger MYM-type protein 4-like isoform X3 n=1 Tax=Silurus asotus TaxID=30991 RepID=A0AAD5FCS6_SILAS|nr:zinc finger MYM-type protein 4-like isoform X3 [Silurus asotus]